MQSVTRSLTTKQIIQVTLVSLITIFIFIIIQFSYFIEERRDIYIEQLERISSSIEQPLSQAVWNSNDQDIQDILDGLNSVGFLTEATVVMNSQYRALHSRFPSLSSVPDWFSHLFRLPITIKQPLYAPGFDTSDNNPIAQLVLKTDPYRMYRFVLQAGMTTLMTIIVLSLMLVVAISWIMNKLLISPLKTLANALSTFPKGTTHQLSVPENHDNDELGMLVKNYNLNQQALERAYQDLRRISTRDPLTDLPNRVLFEELLNQYLANSYKEESEFSVLYVSISSIKDTVSALGIPVTEQILIIVSDRLKQIVTSPNILARIGGNEFIILVPDEDKALKAMLLAQNIIKHITSPIISERLKHYLSASIGIAHYPNDGHSASQLLSHAHSALSSAEKQGRNTILFFEPYLTESIQKRLLLENDITRGIQNNEFKLYLQPQIDMRTNTVIGAEALVRWHHSDNKVRSPNNFIPLAEETGLMIPLGEKVFEQACQYIADWQKQNIHIPISVNLAAAQIESPDFPMMLKYLVQKYNISPKQLKLEVTETGRLDDITRAINLLEHLHKQGFPIVLDDFGIGHSNLNYLRLLNIDTLKIDKSFIEEERPHDQALVNIVGTIAKEYEANVIAEGVETQKQKEWLIKQGIYYGQGFLYDPALTKEVFEERYLFNAAP